MLMRNLDVSRHLVNGKRGIVKRAQPNAHFILVDFGIEDDLTPIPRINFKIQPHGQTFHVLRKQFPLKPAAALTIHKAQAQTLHRVVLDLRRGLNTLCPGQLYVALSRVMRREDIMILTQKRNIVNEYPNRYCDVKVTNYVAAELVNIVKAIETGTYMK